MSLSPASTAPGQSGAEAAARAVTALFVPGDRPERFAKAAAAGAGAVIIDLEDAVAPASKPQALVSALEALQRGALSALVRVNSIEAPTHAAEVSALLELADRPGHGLLGLMVPKAEDSAGLDALAERTSARGLGLVPLIESAAGILAAPAIASIAGVTRLAFGAIDYALDIGAGSEDRFLDHARSALVVSSRAAGKAAPLDSPVPEIKDVERVAASARLARGFGFTGKLCIHPAQIAAVAEAFRPSAEEVEWARSVAGADAGASQIGGAMIDRPVIGRAQRILDLIVEEES